MLLLTNLGSTLVTIVFLGIYISATEVYVPRTVDQCYGEPIPVACHPGYMVQVNSAYYRQTENCRGGFHSNYCSREEPSNPACVGNQTCVFTTPWVYLSPACSYSNNFLITYQCIPVKVQVDICSAASVLTRPSGYISSPNYTLRPGASKNCSIRIKVGPGMKINIYLLDLYLAYYNDDLSKQCVDAVWINDGHQRTDYLCSGKQRGLIFTSKIHTLTIFFRSENHDYLNAKGFWIYYEAWKQRVVGPTSVPASINNQSARPSIKSALSDKNGETTNPYLQFVPTSILPKTLIKDIDSTSTNIKVGIIGGTVGCILLVLAFIALGLYWNRHHPILWKKSKKNDKARKKKEGSDIILAYGSSDVTDTAGLTNYTLEQDSPPPSLHDFPSDVSVVQSNPHYAGTLHSWRGLVPIDERPEIIYTQAKRSKSDAGNRLKANRKTHVRSKSLEDLRNKINAKLKRRPSYHQRQFSEPLEAGLWPSKSMDCLCKDYENVIIPPHYATMNRNHRSYMADPFINPAIFCHRMHRFEPQHLTARIPNFDQSYLTLMRQQPRKHMRPPPPPPLHAPPPVPPPRHLHRQHDILQASHHLGPIATSEALPHASRRTSSVDILPPPHGYGGYDDCLGVYQTPSTNYQSLVIDGQGTMTWPRHQRIGYELPYETVQMQGNTEDEVAL